MLTGAYNAKRNRCRDGVESCIDLPRISPKIQKLGRLMSNPNIEDITCRIEQAIQALASQMTTEVVWTTHYGANDIHPKHLVYWICVESEQERQKLSTNQQLKNDLRALLVTHNYPIEGRAGVRIGFESQEAVDRDSGGNWRHHWQ